LLLILLVPLPALALELLLVRAARSLQWFTHLLLVGVLSLLVAVQACKRIPDLPGMAVVAAGVCAAFVLVLVYHRWSTARSFVTVLSMALVAIPLVFLRSPEIAELDLGRSALSDLELPSLACRTPVVFIVCDELPTSLLIDEQGRINRHRYPHLAELAAQASWFPNATTVSETTALALPAILSGKIPVVDSLPALSHHPHNLFTLFGRDYEMWVQEPVINLCPEELNRYQPLSPSAGARLRLLGSDLAVVYLHLLLPPAWTRSLPPIDHTWSGFGATTVAARPEPGKQQKGHFQRALDAIKSDRRQELESFRTALRAGDRQLYFQHVLLPHRPYQLHPPDHEYQVLPGVMPGVKGHGWSHDEVLVAQAYQRLMLQMQWLDHAIGRLVSRLHELDLFEQTLIVLTADHGVSIRAGHETSRLVSDDNAEDILPVPILIKAPHQSRGELIEAPVRTIDILPTMLDLLGEAPPWPMDGTSVFARPAQERTQLPVLTKARGVLTFDSAVLGQRLRQAAAARLAQFGNGSDPLDLYRIGPYPDLVGQPLAGLEQGQPSSAGLRLKRREQLAGHDPDGLLVPVHLEGELVSGRSSESGRDLAVAINGTVCATTRSWGNGKLHRFSVMVPLHLLQSGDNQVELLAIESRDGRAILHRIGEDNPLEHLRRAGLLGAHSSHAHVLPAAANVPGTEGTTWLTDLVLHNPGREDASVQLVYLGQESDPSPAATAEVVVPAATSGKLADVVGRTFDRPDSAGAILVGSDQPLLVSSRTFNQTGVGTYSQLIPGVPLANAIRGTAEVSLVHLTGPAPARTNIGFVNLGAEPLGLTADIHTSDGRHLRTVSVTLAPFSSRQIDRVLGNRSGTANCYAVVTATSVHATYLTYASVIDSASGDPSFVMPALAAGEVAYLPVVRSLDDPAGGTWRSLVAVHSCGRHPATFRVSLLGGSDMVGERMTTGKIVVKTGSSIRVTDILSDVFGATGSAGLRFDLETGKIMVTSATYLELENGARGQIIPGCSSAQALYDGDEARLVQLSSGAGYRTMLGLCSIADHRIEVAVELYAGDGRLLGQRTFSLPAGSVILDHDLVGAVTSAEIDDAFAVLRSDTPGAAYFAHASVVDTRSRDPLYIPGQRTP
jgi:hypothetical protein